MTTVGTTQAAPLNNQELAETQEVAQVETDPEPSIEPVKPEPVVQAAEEPVVETEKVDSHQPTPAPLPQVRYSTNKEELMTLVGIPKHEWAAVDEIITRESGWKHLVWNTSGSGAYGLCQSLPASKMASAGADYLTNPVTQLKWCNQYAQGYGGWVRAAEFSRCLGSCYSNRAGKTVYKDHKWW